MDRSERGPRPIATGSATGWSARESGSADPAGAGPASAATPEAEDALWERLTHERDRTAFLSAWLTLQCRVVRSARRGLVLLREPAGAYVPAATWPAGQAASAALVTAAEKALTDARGVVVAPPEHGPGEPALLEGPCVAEPIRVGSGLHGAVVVEVAPRPESDLGLVSQQLRFGQGWLRALAGGGAGARPTTGTAERLETVLSLLAAALEHDRFQGAATAFATELATLLDCERASVGFEEGDRARVRALSHSADFGARTNLIRAIEAAMDEALDQRSTLVYPPRDELKPRGCHAQAELARQFGAGAICTVPLLRGGRSCGAITLERRPDLPFDGDTVALLEAVAAFAGPALDVHRREDRWLGAKIVESARAAARDLASTRDVVVKLAASVVAVLVLFLAIARGEYRVTADAVLEPAVKRAAAAPFDGFVARAPVRAGDVVKEGALLASLDDRDLQLERLKWESEQTQQQKQYRQALADRDAPQASILAAALEEARAELHRIEDRLGRVDLRAPFDGVVVTGDLSQKLGAPVQKGEVLFEVAPLDAYRLHVKVDERDIADVAAGQTGTLVLSSLPRESFEFEVKKLTPVSTAEEGRNTFRVEAALVGETPRVLPGTQGVAKIVAGRRSLAWIWTHRAVDWLRLRLWTWMP